MFGFKAAKNKARSRLAMELRLVDLNTGITTQVVRTQRPFGADAVQFEANLSQFGASMVPILGRDHLKNLERLSAAHISVARNGFVQSPIGELFALAINDLAEKLLSAMDNGARS